MQFALEITSGVFHFPCLWPFCQAGISVCFMQTSEPPKTAERNQSTIIVLEYFLPGPAHPIYVFIAWEHHPLLAYHFYIFAPNIFNVYLGKNYLYRVQLPIKHSPVWRVSILTRANEHCLELGLFLLNHPL